MQFVRYTGRQDTHTQGVRYMKTKRLYEVVCHMSDLQKVIAEIVLKDGAVAARYWSMQTIDSGTPKSRTGLRWQSGDLRITNPRDERDFVHFAFVMDLNEEFHDYLTKWFRRIFQIEYRIAWTDNDLHAVETWFNFSEE